MDLVHHTTLSGAKKIQKQGFKIIGSNSPEGDVPGVYLGFGKTKDYDKDFFNEVFGSTKTLPVNVKKNTKLFQI